MKKLSAYFLIVLSVVLYACGGKVQTMDLSKEYATTLHYDAMTEGAVKADEGDDDKSDLVGVPAKNFYGGDLKRGGIWYGAKNVSLEKGDIFIFDAENAGPDSIPFGATFPPLDMNKEKVFIKINARSEGKPGEMPTLYLELDDATGYKADAKRPSQQIENSAEFKDYVFDLTDMYYQRAPKHKVNPALINSIKFFINPGKNAYTGKIYIKEIRVLPVPVEKK
jgi:hypothetical protein